MNDSNENAKIGLNGFVPSDREAHYLTRLIALELSLAKKCKRCSGLLTDEKLVSDIAKTGRTHSERATMLIRFLSPIGEE